jgi:hypothetical protein
LFSFGKIPYPGMSNVDVIREVSNGYRMPCPADCPQKIYIVMNACWNADPTKRPSFCELAIKFEELTTEYKQPNTIMSDTDHVISYVEPMIYDDYNN